MKSLAIIPARSGSKGLKDKNIYNIDDRPLIDFTISSAIQSKCFSKVMVSTDSLKYSEIATDCGAEVPFMRDISNSGDSASSWDVVREVLGNYAKKGILFDYVALLQPTSPLRDSNDIIAAFNLLGDNVNSVVSVCETSHPIQWCFKLDSTLLMTEYSKSKYNQMRRQDLDKYYMENGAIYIVDAKKIMDANYNLYEDNCKAYIMDRMKSIDIDSIEDILYLKALLEYQKKER